MPKQAQPKKEKAKYKLQPKDVRMTDQKVIYLNIKDIHPYEKNPRKITEDAINAVVESIKLVGYKNYIVVDKNNVIICGHTRLKALQKLQLEDEAMMDFTKIPCILADDLTQDEVKAFRLIDNKASEFSLWDMDLLGVNIGEIDTVDMTKFGFSDIPIEEEEVEEEPKEKKDKKVVCPQCGFKFDAKK